MKQYLTAKEVAEVTGASQGKAYGIIRELNEELKAAGYITIAARNTMALRELQEERHEYTGKVVLYPAEPESPQRAV